MDAHTQPWCSTKVNKDGEHESGAFKWGNCADVCFEGFFNPKAYFADETRSRALIAKAAYDQMWDYSRISTELKNERATGMTSQWAFMG